MCRRRNELLALGLGAAVLLLVNHGQISFGDSTAGANSQSKYRWVPMSQGGNGELKIVRGQSRVLRAQGKIERREITDPKVAEIVELNSSQFAVIGLEPGTAELRLWFQGSIQPLRVGVLVVPESGKQMGASSAAQQTGPEPGVTQAGFETGPEPGVTQAGFETGPELGVTQAGFETGPESGVTQAGFETVVAAGTPADWTGLPIDGNTNFAQSLPTISLETSSPLMCELGQVVEQQILVRNLATNPVDRLVVHAAFSRKVRLVATLPEAKLVDSTLVWELGRLDAHGQKKLSVRLSPLATGELRCIASAGFSTSATVDIQVERSKLELVCSGPNEAVKGSTVGMTVTVINVGSAVARKIRVYQSLSEVQQAGSSAGARPFQIDVGTLRPGESRTLQAKAIARQPGLLNVQLVCESADGARATAQHKVRVVIPKLALKADGPRLSNLNEETIYQVSLSNTGDGLATKVNLMVGIPEGLQFIDSGDDAVYNSEKRTVGWDVGVLYPGEQRQFIYRALAKAEGEHLQRAVAWAEGDLLGKSDIITRVKGAGSLRMEITGADDLVEIGRQTTYRVQVVNQSGKAVESVQIGAAVPTGVELVSVEAPTSYQIRGRNVIFQPIPRLETNYAADIALTLRPVQAGQHRFHVELVSPSVGQPLIAEKSITVQGR